MIAVIIFLILYFTIGVICLGIINGLSIVEDTDPDTILQIILLWPVLLVISIFLGIYKMVFILTKKIKIKIRKK